MQILTDSSKFVRAGNLDWQQHMKAAIRKPEDLIQRLKLPENSICQAQSLGSFPLFVPLPYLSRIEPGNIDDPLLRQVLPITDESKPIEGFSADPLNEASFTLSPGLLQKYNQRALLIVNGTCAVHCRYCFRRHFPYSDAVQDDRRLDGSLAKLDSDDSIQEVILSGGDPLTLVDDRFERLINRLEQIPHVSRLRIHSRLPVVIPQRVTDRLLTMLHDSRLQVIFVIHANHANEIDDDVAMATRAIGQACHAVLNQSVLLRGVNDNMHTLQDLSETLIGAGVIPYYLHQLDAVSGSAHFQVSTQRGIELVQQLRETISGYLVPRFVQEIPGELNKTVLA